MLGSKEPVNHDSRCESNLRDHASCCKEAALLDVRIGTEYDYRSTRSNMSTTSRAETLCRDARPSVGMQCTSFDGKRCESF